jgi:Region found in RelA / SpoT proteins
MDFALDADIDSAEAPEIGAVSEFPTFEYGKREVMRAGEMIAGELPWNEQSAPDIKKAFMIANRWRDSHAYPMKSVRLSLMAFMRLNGIKGITVARLKRMQAIRKKLRRPNSRFTLNQLQDLGGCRVIVDSVADVGALVEILRKRIRHEIRHEDDYVITPKPDGYRSHHIILSYCGRDGAERYTGRRVEVQVRTRLQTFVGNRSRIDRDISPRRPKGK